MENHKKISVLILTQNSALTLRRTLESVKGFDEVLVVDGGSEDETLEIASQYGAKILKNSFKGFSEQRNFALKNATYDWCLFVDSDEAVTTELQQELYKVIDSSPPYVIFKIMRTEYILGEEIKFGHGRSGYQERFYYRPRVSYAGEVHEYPVIDGKKPTSDSNEMGHINNQCRLLHNPNVSMRDFVRKVGTYSLLRGNEKTKLGRKCSALSVILIFPLTFCQIYLKSFRQGKRGFMAAVMEAVHRTLVKLLIYEKTHF